MYLIGILILMVVISSTIIFVSAYFLLSKGKKRLEIINRYLRFSILITSIILALLISCTIILTAGASFYFGLGSIEVQLIFIIWVITIMLLLTRVLIPIKKIENEDNIKCMFQYKGSKIIAYLYGLVGFFIILQFILFGLSNLFNMFIVLLIGLFLIFAMWKGLFKSKVILGEEYLKYSINILADIEIMFEDISYIETGKNIFGSRYIDIFYKLGGSKEEEKIRISYIKNMDNFIISLIDKSKRAEIDEDVKGIVHNYKEER